MNIYYTKNSSLKTLLIMVILGVFLIVSLISMYWEDQLVDENPIACYHSIAETLPDISNVTPRKGQSIFFHETSCTSFYKGKIVINARQACAVESAASLNPNLDIYLLYSSPGVIKFDGHESDVFLKALLSYKNVNIMYLNSQTYLKGTPVEDLFNNGVLEMSKFVVEHARNILSYVTLWKYGGIYLDLDMMLIKCLEKVLLNFAGIESREFVGSSVLGVDQFYGPFLEDCLNDLRDNFDGKSKTRNNVGVITKKLKSTCNVTQVPDMLFSVCSGFSVYPRSTFYPVPAGLWRQFFNQTYLEELKKVTLQSYSIRFWNKYTADIKIPLISNVPLLHFARKYCPKVVSACNEFF